MYCGQCGTLNQDDAGQCETCGASLRITTGARACQICGGALGDLDRFCTTCGTQVGAMASGETYDAADDFGELDIDDIQLDELPDWLQSMAPAPAPQTEPQPQHPRQSGDQPSPDDLPDWLRDSPADSLSGSAAEPVQPSPPQPVRQEHQPADQFSLVSDDDLPDWLKALSDDDDVDDRSRSTQVSTPQPSPRPAQPRQPTTAVANLYEVPSVSRAWLTQGRSIDQAQVTAARQEFSPLEALSGVSISSAGAQSIWDSGPIDSASDDQSTRPFAVSQDESGSGRGKLIVRLVMLVLLIIVTLILAFVLIQGV